MTYLGDKDFYYEVARGNVSGARIFYAMGERENIGTTVTGEDVWRGNELTPSPTSHTELPLPPDIGEQMTVVSESTSDAAAGTGIQTMRLHYLDASGAEQTEDITLNGTTPVDTVATKIRFVQDMHALTVGSQGVAVGHIKIYSKADSGIVYSMIQAGTAKQMVPTRMVPAGKELILRAWSATEGNAKRCAFRIRTTSMYGTLIPRVFHIKDTAYLNKDSLADMLLYRRVPPLGIIKVTGWATVASAEGSCGWWGVLRDL